MPRQVGLNAALRIGERGALAWNNSWRATALFRGVMMSEISFGRLIVVFEDVRLVVPTEFERAGGQDPIYELEPAQLREIEREELSPAGLAEAGAPFDAVGGRTRVSPELRVQVLKAYGNSCAVTWAHPGTRALLDVITTRSHVARPTVSDCLPLRSDVAKAFTAGRLTIAASGHIILDMTLSATLRNDLNNDGKLRLPADPLAHPDREALAIHRAEFARDLARG